MKNAFEGYNCSLFAYGQTGAGKSYSVMGYGNDKGLVPLILDGIFNDLKGKTESNYEWSVVFGMMEIYNEKV